MPSSGSSALAPDSRPQARSPDAPRTYLVTGVAGFIAARVAELLLAEGHTVVGVDNLNDYYDVRLKDYRLSKLLGASGFRLGADPKKSVYAGSTRLEAQGAQLAGAKSGRFIFCHLDIESQDALERLFARWDFAAVFNLAARAGVRASLKHPEIYRTTNILGEQNVLNCQVKFGVRKHVLASSSSVYAGCPMPFTEDAPPGPLQSPYAETKRQAELLALRFHREHGLDVSVLRYFTVFGPAGRPDMAPFRFIKWIDEGTPITLYGDGTQARDFTYIDDIARGTILAGKLFGDRSAVDSDQPAGRDRPPATGDRPPSAGYNIINLGGGRRPLSLLTVIGHIEKALTDRERRTEGGGQSATGHRQPVRAIISGQPPSAADMKETWADITQAKRLLNWQPAISAEEGFRRAVDWHLQNRELLADIKL